MHPYLNVKPTYPPTFLPYNGTRSGPGFWGDPTTPMLLIPLALFLICSGILCNFIKLKYCPNTCWVSSHPTEAANRPIRRTPVRVQPTPTIQQLTRQVDVLTSVLLELVQDENRIQDELEKNINEDIENNENNNDQNNNDETKTETSEISETLETIEV